MCVFKFSRGSSQRGWRVLEYYKHLILNNPEEKLPEIIKAAGLCNEFEFDKDFSVRVGVFETRRPSMSLLDRPCVVKVEVLSRACHNSWQHRRSLIRNMTLIQQWFIQTMSWKPKPSTRFLIHLFLRYSFTYSTWLFPLFYTHIVLSSSEEYTIKRFKWESFTAEEKKQGSAVSQDNPAATGTFPPSKTFYLFIFC